MAKMHKKYSKTGVFVDIKWVCSIDTDPFLIRFVATATSLFLFFGGNYENNLDSKSNR